MEKYLINYILELCDSNDNICEELHSVESEREYCEKNCQNLTENCVRRLMVKRIFEEN